MSSVSSQCLAVVTVTPILSLVKTLVKRTFPFLSNFLNGRNSIITKLNTKKLRVPITSIYQKKYNFFEQFIPLIGGGEFRWHFKHLVDSIIGYKIIIN